MIALSLQTRDTETAGYPNGKNKTELDLHLTHTDGTENVYVENKA